MILETIGALTLLATGAVLSASLALGFTNTCATQTALACRGIENFTAEDDKNLITAVRYSFNCCENTYNELKLLKGHSLSKEQRLDYVKILKLEV